MKPFPTSAACCFGILFISVSLKTTGSSEVVGSADPVVALAGDDVILPCSLKPRVSAEDMLVKWTGLFLETRNVHLYLDGRDSNADQFPSYRRRTSMFNEELKNGNVSLKLTRVTLSDAGSYRCFIPTLTSQVKETTVQLIVGAVSQPVISIDGTKGWGVVLKCESGGWYPEPEMEWLDSSGSILPADGPPERHLDKEGLYAVRQHVTVDKTDTNRFTCIVQQQKINHLKETEIHVPDLTFPKSQLILGLLITAAVGVLAACIGVYMWRKHKELKFKKSEVMRDARFVDINRFHLIHNVTMVIPIAFYLIRSEKYSKIRAAVTREDQMELLYEALDSGGEQLKSDFYRILLDLQPDVVINMGVIFVDVLKDHLIQKVTNVKPIICELLDEKAFNFRINQVTSQDQMTRLYMALEEAEITQKLELYRILLDLEPDLVSDLDSEDLYLYVLIQNLSGRIGTSTDSDDLYLYKLIQNLSRRIEVVILWNGTSTDSDDLYLYELQNLSIQLDQLIRQKEEVRRLMGTSTDSDEDDLYLYELQNLSIQLEPFRMLNAPYTLQKDPVRMQSAPTIMQSDEAITERDEAITERDEAITERDEAITERAPYTMQNAPYTMQNAPYTMQNAELIMQKAELIRQKAQFRRERDEATRERDELKEQLNLRSILRMAQFRRERDELKEELKKAKETIQTLSTSPGGQQKTQTPSQKSEGEGMEMKPLLGSGPPKDDLDEMERGGRV